MNEELIKRFMTEMIGEAKDSDDKYVNIQITLKIDDEDTYTEIIIDEHFEYDIKEKTLFIAEWYEDQSKYNRYLINTQEIVMMTDNF